MTSTARKIKSAKAQLKKGMTGICIIIMKTSEPLKRIFAFHIQKELSHTGHSSI